MRVPIGLRVCVLAVIMRMRLVVGVLRLRMLLLPILFPR